MTRKVISIPPTPVTSISPSGVSEVVITGQAIGGRMSVVTLNSTTWTALPAVPLTDRNALAVQNDSGIEIKLNYDPAAVGYVGITLKTDRERFYDVTGAIVLYAKSASGTPSVNVEEIA